jgi:hypothetical protein
MENLILQEPDALLIVDDRCRDDERTQLARNYLPTNIARANQDLTPSFMEAASDDTLPQLWIHTRSDFCTNHSPPSGWRRHPDQPYVLVSPGWMVFDMARKKQSSAK